MKVLKLVEKNLEKFILCTLLAAICCVMFTQVIVRYIFNSGIPWAEELSRFCLVTCACFAVGYAIRQDCLLRIDMLLNKMNYTLKTALELFSYALLTFVFVYLMRYSFTVTYVAWKGGTASAAMHMPMWVLYGSETIGLSVCAARAVQYSIKFIIKLTGVREKGAEA